MPISVSQNTPPEYVYIRACSKHASLFSPTSGFPKWLSLYTHIWISKDTPLSMDLRESLTMLLYISLWCSQKCLCVYAQIFVCEPKSVSKDAFLFMLIFEFHNLFYMPIFQSQKHPSVYTHVRVSIYASIYMPIARIALSKCIYAVLKKFPYVYARIWVSKVASQYIPILGFPKIPISIWLHMSLSIHPRCFSACVNITFSIHTPSYKLIFGC